MISTRYLGIALAILANVKSDIVLQTIYIDTSGGKYYQILPIDWFVKYKRIHYKVQAIEDAYFAFFTEINDENPLFEIVIGAEKNTVCFIKKKGKVVAYADTPGILDPGSHKGFWISWHTHSKYLDLQTIFVVRIGHEGDDSAFLTTWDSNLESLPAAYYIGVRTSPKGGNGFWEIDVMYDRTNITNFTSLETKSFKGREPEYDHFYPIINQRIEFKVKIKQDAWILLSMKPQKLEGAYQIILGGWGNTKCAVMAGDSTSKIMVDQKCDGVVNSEYYRGFWISLEYFENTLSIAVGHDGEVIPFIKYNGYYGTIPFYYSVACTGQSGFGHWILKVSPPNLLKYIKTVPTKPVTFTSFDPIPKSRLIMIKTKATRDAWVALSSTLSNQPEFEIIIGGWGNSKSTIRKDGKDLEEYYHNKLLDTGKYFTGFWISVKQEALIFKSVVQKLYLNIEVGQEDQEKPFISHKYNLDKSNPMQLNFYSVGSTLDTDYVEWILEASVRRIDPVIPKYYISHDNPTKYHLYAIESRRVEFEIKTAQAAIISLTTSSRTPNIKVFLGNNVSTIFKDGSPKASIETHSQLSEKVYHGFWITWKYLTKPKRELWLRVGYEGEAGALLEWHDPDPFLIKYIGVDTQKQIGYWKFQDAWLENETDVFMPNFIQTYNHPKTYQFFPIVKSPIRFKVKAGRDANLAFTTNSEKSEPILEVLLGAFGVKWLSQYTYIRKNFKQYKPEEVYIRTPNILSNDKFVSFWINWEYVEKYSNGFETKMVMKLGLEGEEPFLTWEGDDMFPINYVGVTGYRSSAVWIFEDDIEVIEKKQWKEVATFDKGTYKFFPMLAKPLRLQVKTSTDAYIALAMAPNEGTIPILECKIGTVNNTKTIMLFNLEGEMVKYEGDTIGIISNTYYESFWFDWNIFMNEIGKYKMTVYIGRRLDHNHFASLTMDAFDIHYFGIATEGDTAYWHFDELAESVPPYVTTYKHSQEYQFYILPHNALKFHVKAASDAYIALSMSNSSSDVMYEIMIGAELNQKSYIRKNKKIPKDFGDWTDVQLPSAETANILSGSDLRGFWVEWIYKVPQWLKKNVLRISVGRQGEVQPFLRWHDTDPLAIKFIGFTGGNDKTLWKFEDVTEDILPGGNINAEYIEPRAFDFSPDNYTQVTTYNLKYQFFSIPTQKITFKVKTRSEIYIVLSSRPHINSLFPMYEILIGNKNAWIKRANGNPKTIVNTPLVLNDYEFHGFWISWLDGNIDVGFIDQIKPFMRWIDPEPFYVNFIGITSRASATWQLNDTIIQRNDDKYQIFPIAADKTMFLLKASEDVRLKLTTEKEEWKNPIIEIIMGSNGNTEITFRNEDLFHSKKLGGVLNNNSFKGFWVSWALGQFTVGSKGDFIPLAYFNDSKPSSPNYIVFSGKNGTTTTWQFKVAPVWKPVQWNSNNDNPCFFNPQGQECIDRNLLYHLLKNNRPEDEKRLVNDCDNARWKNAFQCHN